MQRTIISKLGKFAVHYDVSGVHAVSPVDNDGNNIPDYVDSAAYYFDYSYIAATEQLGYQPAPTDITNGNPVPYNVYLWDVARVAIPPPSNTVGVYGVTIPCGPALSGGGQMSRYKTYIILDNNFSPSDTLNKRQVFNTFGIDALKVTAAHEYHHAIQIGNYGYTINNTAPYETAGVWVETLLFPQVHDYIYYLNGFFNNEPDKRYGMGEQSAGYGNVLFYMYLSKVYGNSIIKRMWEYIGEGTNVFRALDNALIERKSDLNKAWCEFMPWVYYTGTRAQSGEYFPDGKLYPMLKISSQEYFSEPSLMRSGVIRAFEMQLTRAIFRKQNPSVSSDTADFLITNPNKEVAFMQNDLWRNLEFVISRDNLPNPLSGTPYSWKITPPELYVATFFSAGINSVSLDYAYPSPFCPEDGDGSLLFPVPVSTPFDEKAVLSIYSPSWQNIYSGALTVAPDGEHKIIRWLPELSSISTGVYIYTLDYNGELIAQGKFSVIRK
ncbi:hypothetical protein MASR2M18_01440 [Ignavibacteria bacterium]